MVKRFLASGRTGFYLAVAGEGKVGAGDEIVPIGSEENGVPLPAIVNLYVAQHYGGEEMELIRRVMRVEAVPNDWKNYFRKRLEKMKELT
jgi:MOSC domain-containing protein YiiM